MRLSAYCGLRPALTGRIRASEFIVYPDQSMTSKLPTTLMANAIRALAMDAVQKANTKHPGMPMGMAEIAVALWSRHHHQKPTNPHWINRDRFVLSNGHGSMLLY